MYKFGEAVYFFNYYEMREGKYLGETGDGRHDIYTGGYNKVQSMICATPNSKIIDNVFWFDKSQAQALRKAVRVEYLKDYIESNLRRIAEIQKQILSQQKELTDLEKKHGA
jgi:hypothetical protein